MCGSQTVLLHDYFYDLAYLPGRQVKLAFARLFPSLGGLKDRFNAEEYSRTKSDYSTGHFVIANKAIDMEAEVPAEVLGAQSLPRKGQSFWSNVLMRCCNEGDDHVYLNEIAKIAKIHGARLIFVNMPAFKDPRPLSDLHRLTQYGIFVDNNDLTQNAKLYYNRIHFNHAGAVIVSDRIAKSIM